MSDQKEVVKKAKGTRVTENIIGAASSKILMATKNLGDAVAQALKLTETLDENALKIADQEEKLALLSNEFNNKKTQMGIDLDLAYQANQKEFAEKYLTANSLVAVKKDEFVALNDEVATWKKDFDTKVSAEIGKAKGMADGKIEAERKLSEAEYRAKEAGNLAEIKNLQSQLSFANQQIQVWKEQLNDERKASVDRSKNTSATVNVAGGGK